MQTQDRRWRLYVIMTHKFYRITRMDLLLPISKGDITYCSNSLNKKKAI